MPDEKTDNELIADYRRGEDDALRVLIERYANQAYRFAYQLTHMEKDAEDVAQEAFVKAWRHLNRYDQKQRFKTWLFAIIRNSAIDYLRKRKETPFSDIEIGDSQFDIEDTTGGDSVFDEIVRHIEDKAYFQRLFKELSQSDQEILRLYYYEQFTFREIGVVLNEPLNTVKSRHRRALSHLRDLAR